MSNPDLAEIERRITQMESNPELRKNLESEIGGLAKASAGVGSQRAVDARMILGNVREAFTYAPWDQSQVAAGREVTEAFIAAAEVVFRMVPESPLRTRAIDGLFDARMIANAAITHRGKF